MPSSEQRGQTAPDCSETELDSGLTPDGLAPSGTGGSRGDSGSFAKGQLLADRFQIVRWIASGGMGDVYEARDLELGERVAVKTIRREIASDRQAMDRFRREISLARRVTHPGVCRIFDVFFHVTGETPETGDSVDPIAFLTMELLEGVTLSEHLREVGPMSSADAWPLVRQMAAALAAAHEAGVIHRDFKCSNVMLVGGSQAVRAVITDFGLARRTELDAAAEVTTAGDIVGSPAYMAPEQATGGEITPATDVYSLGVVIYSMVTGRLPFEAASPLATLVRRTREDPPPPSRHAGDLDPRWEAVIMKCLAREPAARFADAAAVLAELEPAKGKRQLSRRLRRRLRWVEVFLVLSLMVAAVAHLPIFRSGPEPATVPIHSTAGSRQSVAVLGFKNLSGRHEAAWLATALTELLATELAAGGGLRTVPGENVARMKIELAVQETDGLAADTLRSIGNHLNTHFVVQGSYLATGASAGSQLRLDLRVQETATGETVATLSETATEAELLGLVCRLGAELRQSLGLDQPPSAAPVMEGAALPANPRAARLYAEGLTELRNFDAQAARDLLRQAVAADPDYALAHAALAEALSTLGYDAEAMDQISIAFGLSSGLPRRERMLVEGQYRELTREWDRAIEIYRTLVDTYPDGLEYGLDLVRTQIRGSRMQDAEATLEGLRGLAPPAADDPRIDLAEADLAWSQAQFPRTLEVSTRAADKGRRQGARLLAARGRRSAARALWRLGRLDEAVAATGEAERTLLELGDRAGAAAALNLQGVVLYERGELQAALEVYDRALAVFREIGFRAGIDGILNNQAIVLQVQGDLEGAAELYQETLQIARQEGDKSHITIGLYNLALVRRQQGRTAAAKQMQEEALAIAREIENDYLVATRLLAIGNLDRDAGDLEAARYGYLETLRIMRRLDNQDGVAYALHHLAQLDRIENDLASVRRRCQEALAIRDRIGAVGRALESRVILARLALDEGNVQEAMGEAGETAAAAAAAGFPSEEAGARAVQAEAALAAGRLAAAREAVDRALELTGSVEGVGLEVAVAIAAARVLAAEGRPSEALGKLDAALRAAADSGRLGLELVARLARGEIELRVGRVDRGRARLARVEQDASARGFLLLAHKARQLSSGG